MSFNIPYLFGHLRKCNISKYVIHRYLSIGITNMNRANTSVKYQMVYRSHRQTFEWSQYKWTACNEVNVEQEKSLFKSNVGCFRKKKGYFTSTCWQEYIFFFSFHLNAQTKYQNITGNQNVYATDNFIAQTNPLDVYSRWNVRSFNRLRRLILFSQLGLSHWQRYWYCFDCVCVFRSVINALMHANNCLMLLNTTNNKHHRQLPIFLILWPCDFIA